MEFQLLSPLRVISFCFCSNNIMNFSAFVFGAWLHKHHILMTHLVSRVNNPSDCCSLWDLDGALGLRTLFMLHISIMADRGFMARFSTQSLS